MFAASHGLCCYIANTHYCYIYNLLPRAHLTTSIAFTTPSISLQLDSDLIHVLSTQTVDTYTSRHCATATLSPWRKPNSDENNEEFWLCQVKTFLKIINTICGCELVYFIVVPLSFFCSLAPRLSRTPHWCPAASLLVVLQLQLITITLLC